MTTPRAADLPEGSVVAIGYVAWIKRTYGWQVTGMGISVPDDVIDQYLAGSAAVLRAGTGQGSR